MLSAQGTFVSNVKLLMESHGWSGAELARKSNVSNSMIAYILKGERQPTLETAEAIASAFKVPLWAIINPSIPVELARSGRLSNLVKNYAKSGDKAREYIDDIAQFEAARRSA